MRVEAPFLVNIAQIFIDQFKDIYAPIQAGKDHILDELQKEEERFGRTLKKGIVEFQKMVQGRATGAAVSGKEAFYLFESFGFPIEMTAELAAENGFAIDRSGYDDALVLHQEKSRTATEGRFKGGLADHDKMTVALHTSCHLMLSGLRKILGPHVYQAGSNITPERLRFDFTHPQKVSPEQLRSVEAFVNNAIASGFKVEKGEEPKEAARARGVVGSFWEKYPDPVQIYRIVDNQGHIISEELCGGPHVDSSDGIQGFNIVKEEASSAGVRRIKATLALAPANT